MFFAYAILTQDECTLFVNPASLSEDVRSYLHSNDVTILEYERVWGSLEALGKQAKDAAAAPPTTDVDMKEAAGESDKKDKEEKQPEEKLEKTNKVLIGKTTSWAVAKALGEVCRARQRQEKRSLTAPGPGRHPQVAHFRCQGPQERRKRSNGHLRSIR